MIDKTQLDGLLKKGETIWLRERTQTEKNSATELGKEFLGSSNYTVTHTPSNPFMWLILFFKLINNKSLIYFQISSPTTNAFVALLIILNKSVAVHYLDNITGGYPRWALIFQLDKLIYFLLKKAQFTIFISKTMLRFFRRKLKPQGTLSVYYRITPDGDFSDSSSILKYNNCLVYLGAINAKTNLTAIKKASDILHIHGISLHIYTRTNKENFLSRIASPNIKILPEIPPNQVISITSLYEGVLFPFNFDKLSQSFYRMSVPSKLPNTIMSRRPIIYFGPKSFWLFSWLKRHPSYLFRLEEYVKLTDRKKELITKKLAERIYDDFATQEL